MTDTAVISHPHDRVLYVVIPPSPLFAAHWSFFLPDTSPLNTVSRPAHATTGRRIHVAGDRLNGFALEIIRDYDVSKHRSAASRQYPIGIVPASHLQQRLPKTPVEDEGNMKDEDEGGGYVDNVAIDDLESICVEVEAPGPSLRSAGDGAQGSATRKAKVVVRDCQWWIRQVVEVLVERGMLQALAELEFGEVKGPLERMKALPVH